MCHSTRGRVCLCLPLFCKRLYEALRQLNFNPYGSEGSTIVCVGARGAGGGNAVRQWRIRCPAPRRRPVSFSFRLPRAAAPPQYPNPLFNILNRNICWIYVCPQLLSMANIHTRSTNCVNIFINKMTYLG